MSNNKPFNICTTFSCVIHNLPVPKYAVYGIYEGTRYVCTTLTWYTDKTGRASGLNLYIYNPRIKRWNYRYVTGKLAQFVQSEITAHNLYGVKTIPSFGAIVGFGDSIRKHKCNNSFAKHGGGASYYGLCDKSNMTRNAAGEYDFKMRQLDNVVYSTSTYIGGAN